MYDGLSMPGGERWGLLKEKKNGGVRVNMEHHTSPPQKKYQLKKKPLRAPNSSHPTLPLPLKEKNSEEKFAPPPPPFRSTARLNFINIVL